MVVVSFSSRRRHTRCSRDWSSDVCSSDLASRSHRATFARFGADVALCDRDAENMATAAVEVEEAGRSALTAELDVRDADQVERSEERRVGKSVDLGGRRIIKKKKRRYLVC